MRLTAASGRIYQEEELAAWMAESVRQSTMAAPCQDGISEGGREKWRAVGDSNPGPAD